MTKDTTSARLLEARALAEKLRRNLERKHLAIVEPKPQAKTVGMSWADAIKTMRKKTINDRDFVLHRFKKKTRTKTADARAVKRRAKFYIIDCDYTLEEFEMVCRYLLNQARQEQ